MKTSSSLQITWSFADSVHVCEILLVIRVSKCETRNRIFNHTAKLEPKEVGDEDVQLPQSWKHVDPSNCTRNRKLPTSTEHNCLKANLNNSSLTNTTLVILSNTICDL